MSQLAVDHLSPLAARRRLEEVDLEEKSRLAEGLALIALIDSRGDYLEAGYSCMQRYCIEHLRMSEEKAQRRIRAARLGRELPAVFERIADGRLNVTNACELAPVLTSENAMALLDAVAHQPKLQVRRIVIETTRVKTPVPSAPETPRAQSSENDESPAPSPSLEDLCGVTPHDTPLTETAPARVNRQVRGRVIVTQQGERGLQLVLTDEEFAAFKKAQDLLAHVVRNGDPAVVVARSLAHYATHLEKRRFGAKSARSETRRVPRGRNIPAALRHEIAERDGHCCAFVSADGHRCGETRGLQFDHVTPVAQGGETTADNLRLLCANHNRHEAARRLGADHVEAQRELRERARALAKDAKQREEAREAARTEAAPPTAADPDSPSGAPATLSAAERAFARRESDLDTIAALRSLGCSREKAKLAADRTASLADGPLEARVHAAIKSFGSHLETKVDYRRKTAQPSAAPERAA